MYQLKKKKILTQTVAYFVIESITGRQKTSSLLSLDCFYFILLVFFKYSKNTKFTPTCDVGEKKPWPGTI